MRMEYDEYLKIMMNTMIIILLLLLVYIIMFILMTQYGIYNGVIITIICKGYNVFCLHPN